MVYRKRLRPWGGPPLAWLNLIHAKVRLLVAVSAISFAVALIFMQFGLFGAVLKTATLLYDNLKFDIVLISSNSLEATFAQPFSRQRLYQAGGINGVASVMPFYNSFRQWRNPETKLTRSILVLGFNPRDKVFEIPEVYEHLTALQRQDTVLMNRLSRTEFGSREVGIKTELGDRNIEIGGLFNMINSFRADGTVIMSDQNFIRLYHGRSLDDISLGLITVEPGTDVNAVVQRLRKVMPGNIEVLSRREAKTRDRSYWVTSTSTGFIIGVGASTAFMVGTVIVYQVLNTDVTEHLHEYATLKAAGYSNFRLSIVILQEAIILAILGFIPGFFMTLGLYQVIFAATKLPIAMTLELGIIVFLLTVIMCCSSGIGALQKVLVADPADLF